MSRMASMALQGSGILFILALALLPRPAQAQRIGPLVPDNPQQSKASSAEREDELRPPSLQLSLPSPAEVALPPLGPDDLQRLQPQRGRPPAIGVHRRLPQGALKLSISAGGVKSTAEGAWQSTEAGRLWRLKLTSPSARAMRVHFRDFAIGSGRLWIHSEDGQTVGLYSGTGLYGDGDFWSGIVFGDSLTIEYLPDPAAVGEAVPFQIVAISHIWGDAFGEGAEDGVQSPKAAREGSDRSGAVKLLPGPIDLAVGTPSKKSRLTEAIPSVKRSASLQQPRPKAARPLTPGEPVSFSRGPVDSTTLFHGDFSYQLEVPEDATRVTFTLESDADVALLVRYGEDNDVQDDRAVFDYAADEVFAGTEEIDITPESDPPLQAGSYFVSVVVFAMGVEVNCTLTAEVEREGGTPPPPSGRTLRPGQPVTFQRGPVDNSTLFVGPNSFLLEVPEDATSVTFTLESDADVELLVRFGEDNDVQDGRLATDHRHRNRTGNERIVITSQSDPPLRAGSYFISVAVYATGVEVNCTLTAEVELEGEAPPTISGGTLAPGQPADFRLGPVDSPTIFTGDHSFRLEAPENATRITFTLESVDPNVDVDLYVRFGEDNAVQDGKPVSDHFSRGLTGNERIGITHRSDPPLQAGTYFVSILVFDEGVVAEGTLTATVETDAEDCHLDVTCYTEWSSSATGVALMVIEKNGGSAACSGTLLNNRRQDLTPYFLTAAHCVQTEEEARSVTAFWSYQTRNCNGDLPALRSVPRTEGAGLLSALGGARHPDGDITLLQLEGDLPAGTVFQGWDAAPQPVGSQITGIHHPQSADWGFFKRVSFARIIPESAYGPSDDTYFNVSYPVGQGYTEPGSSGSAVFSNSETVVGALSGGDIVGYACPTKPVVDRFTHFSALYPHIRPLIDSTLPEITGGALPPGQPAAFRLGPVDSPMLFSGDSSFQVEVPEGAASVTFTLESVDPDVNVDLYVRYGEDNAVQGGSVVSDYSSTGPTGNEQIVVTPQSAPPLRAGTYYVSLMLRTTRAVAEVTLTAELDATVAPPPGSRIYYFPHLAVGAGWQTTLTYINYSSEAVSCRT
ncbi:MAG: serine protease, partial [Bryobacterales bacterium]|nr:serine protease [Bryobacterales bacterium]